MVFEVGEVKYKCDRIEKLLNKMDNKIKYNFQKIDLNFQRNEFWLRRIEENLRNEQLFQPIERSNSYAKEQVRLPSLKNERKQSIVKIESIKEDDNVSVSTKKNEEESLSVNSN